MAPGIQDSQWADGHQGRIVPVEARVQRSSSAVEIKPLEVADKGPVDLLAGLKNPRWQPPSVSSSLVPEAASFTSSQTIKKALALSAASDKENQPPINDYSHNSLAMPNIHTATAEGSPFKVLIGKSECTAYSDSLESELDPVEQFWASVDLDGIIDHNQLDRLCIPVHERVYSIELLLKAKTSRCNPRPFIFIPPGRFFEIRKGVKIAYRAKAKGRTLEQGYEAERLGKLKLPETPDAVREARRYIGREPSPLRIPEAISAVAVDHTRSKAPVDDFEAIADMIKKTSAKNNPAIGKSVKKDSTMDLQAIADIVKKTSNKNTQAIGNSVKKNPAKNTQAIDNSVKKNPVMNIQAINDIMKKYQAKDIQPVVEVVKKAEQSTAKSIPGTQEGIKENQVFVESSKPETNLSAVCNANTKPEQSTTNTATSSYAIPFDEGGIFRPGLSSSRWSTGFQAKAQESTDDKKKLRDFLDVNPTKVQPIAPDILAASTSINTTANDARPASTLKILSLENAIALLGQLIAKTVAVGDIGPALQFIKDSIVVAQKKQSQKTLATPENRSIKIADQGKSSAIRSTHGTRSDQLAQRNTPATTQDSSNSSSGVEIITEAPTQSFVPTKRVTLPTGDPDADFNPPSDFIECGRNIYDPELHPDDWLECMFCHAGKRYSRKNKLINHQIRHHFYCEKCDECYRHPEELVEHFNQRTDAHNYCEPCDKDYQTLDAYVRHVQQLHPPAEQEVQCGGCKQEMTAVQVIRHLETGLCPAVELDEFNKCRVITALAQRYSLGPYSTLSKVEQAEVSAQSYKIIAGDNSVVNGLPLVPQSGWSPMFDSDAHKITVAGRPAWKCPYEDCDMSTKDHQQFLTHMRAGHFNYGVCPGCFKQFIWASALLQHMMASQKNCRLRTGPLFGHAIVGLSGGLLRGEQLGKAGSWKFLPGGPPSARFYMGMPEVKGTEKKDEKEI